MTGLHSPEFMWGNQEFYPSGFLAFENTSHVLFCLRHLKKITWRGLHCGKLTPNSVSAWGPKIKRARLDEVGRVVIKCLNVMRPGLLISALPPPPPKEAGESTSSIKSEHLGIGLNNNLLVLKPVSNPLIKSKSSWIPYQIWLCLSCNICNNMKL